MTPSCRKVLSTSDKGLESSRTRSATFPSAIVPVFCIVPKTARHWKWRLGAPDKALIQLRTIVQVRLSWKSLESHRQQKGLCLRAAERQHPEAPGRGVA